ncbi:hypothetical protein C4546_03805 [Candidatus Parcubacteria bacterium]|jgi:hypothetical protein|nr:MAG: hypothetical protein C4546_03805 [Candidatus Parcubacteria bacterium]
MAQVELLEVKSWKDFQNAVETFFNLPTNSSNMLTKGYRRPVEGMSGLYLEFSLDGIIMHVSLQHENMSGPLCYYELAGADQIFSLPTEKNDDGLLRIVVSNMRHNILRYCLDIHQNGTIQIIH